MDTYSDKMFLLSKSKFEKGEVDQSISILKDIIAKDPNFSKAYYSLGFSYMGKGEDAKAEAVLLKLIEMEPKLHIAHLQLGKAYENQQKWKQALEFYQSAVRLNPDNPYARMHLGIMYNALNDFEIGVSELQTAYQLNLHEFSVVYNLANGLYKLEQLDEALIILDKAIEIGESNIHDLASLYNLRGRVYRNLSRLHNAELDFLKAIEINPPESRFSIDLMSKGAGQFTGSTAGA